MCSLTGLWALAMLGLLTWLPCKNGSLELSWAWVRSPASKVFAKHCPMHTNRLTSVPITHYHARMNQAHR